jgi:hypothetical protein
MLVLRFTDLVRIRYRLVLHHHCLVQVQDRVRRVECTDYRLEFHHQNQERVQATQYLLLHQMRTRKREKQLKSLIEVMLVLFFSSLSLIHNGFIMYIKNLEERYGTIIP